LCVRKLRELKVHSYCFSVPLFELAFQQVAEEVTVGPVGCRCLLTRPVQLAKRNTESELLQCRCCFLFIRDAHSPTSSYTESWTAATFPLKVSFQLGAGGISRPIDSFHIASTCSLDVTHDPALRAASCEAMIRSALRTITFCSSCSTTTVLPTCSGGTE